MNQTTFISTRSTQDRVGSAIAARLDTAAQHIPHDVSERLKVARMQALAKRRVVGLEVAKAGVTAGSAVLAGGNGGFGFWGKFSSFMPLLALVIGMVAIDFVQDELRAMETAEVDLALLVDELPPAAYTDPGFAHFLRTHESD